MYKIHQNSAKTLFTLTFRSLTEIFIREAGTQSLGDLTRRLTITSRKRSWVCWRHAAARGHCDRHQLHYWKFLSDEHLSTNVPSALQRHLSGTLCQHLFWTVTLWHYLKPDLKLIFSRLFLANWLDLSASASEAIAPRRCTDRVLLLLLLWRFLLEIETWR